MVKIFVRKSRNIAAERCVFFLLYFTLQMFDEKNSIKYKYSTKSRVIDIHAWVELCRSGVSGETYFVWWSIRGTGGTCTIDAEKTHDRRDREHECNVHWPARPRSASPCKCDSLRCTSSPSLSLSLSLFFSLPRSFYSLVPFFSWFAACPNPLLVFYFSSRSRARLK